MGYNIDPVVSVGQPVNVGNDTWAYTADLSDPSVTIVTGQFQASSFFGPVAATFSVGTAVPSGFGTLSIVPSTGVFTFTINRAAIIASGNDVVINFTITGVSGGGQSDTDSVILNILICVARGTLIATPRGLVPVEELQVGDLVLTHDGRAEEIRWIGTRHVSAADLARDPSLRPVRISAGAYGPDQPARDLTVSPQHRILLSGWRAELLFGEDTVLAPAKGLLDDRSVRIDRDADEVEYFHLLFDRHEIILTEGLPSESFYPGSYSVGELDTAARDELLRLFPELDGDDSPIDPAGPGLRPWEARLLATRRHS
jgi:hypothetical protein